MLTAIRLGNITRLELPGARGMGIQQRLAPLPNRGNDDWVWRACRPQLMREPLDGRNPLLMRRSVIAAAVAACFLLHGCGAGWRRQPDLQPGALSRRQQAQVWHQGSVERWHALVISRDSVSGVPYLTPVNCDSCRVALPRAEVDSIRLGNPVAGFWKTVGLVVGVPLLLIGVVCVVGDGGPPCTGRS